MSGISNFPTAIDDNSSLYDVADGVNNVLAAHHNNPKEAIKAIEAKLGINQTTDANSIDFRLGSATGSHRHDGASGQGLVLNPTTLLVPSGGFPSGLSLYEHMMDGNLHNATAIAGTGIASALGLNVIFVPTTIPRHVMRMEYRGSAVVGSNVAPPLIMGRTMQIEAVGGALRRGPSGATTAFDILIGPTSIFQASPGLQPIFAPGATAYRSASPNLITYPSGAVITVDVDAVGSSDPGQDLGISFVFRE